MKTSLTFLFYIIVIVSASSSYFNKAIKHDLRGQSLGKRDGLETYEYEGHTYYFHDEAVTWSEAYTVCQNESGYLAILEDINEVDFVSNAMDGSLCSFVAFQNAWIGGKFSHEIDRWVWAVNNYEIKGKIGEDDGYPPWKISERPGYDCLLLDQDLTHKPKFTDLECYRRRRFLCEQGCFRLRDPIGGHWEPEICVIDPNHPGDDCTLVCDPDHVIDGDGDITCTNNGWDSPGGLNEIPKCKDGGEVGDDIIDKINITLTGDDEFLFVIDESVQSKLFDLEKKLSKSIVKTFPLSSARSAGTITYNTQSEVDITVSTDVTCKFLAKTNKIQQQQENNNDLTIALKLAKTEIDNNKAHSQTIVFIIAAGALVDAETILAAEALKQSGNVIIAIGVSNRNISTLATTGDVSLYIDVGNEVILQTIINKIDREYAVVSDEDCPDIVECEGLDNTDRGHWEPASCNDATAVGKICRLVCNADYSVHGPSNLTCSEDGWQTPGNYTDLPECYTPEEIGDDFGDKVNSTLSKYINASLLFILDQSGSVPAEDFELEKNFVKAITNAFPLSPVRKGGLLKFSTHAETPIPLTVTDSCIFFKKVDPVRTNGGYTHIDEALDEANLECIRNNADEKTLIFLITDGKSQTDPFAAANRVKSRGDIIFTVGVADYDESQLIPVASVDEQDKTPNFFGITSFEVFEKVAEYLNTTYAPGPIDCSNLCRKLENTDRGFWTPAQCSAQDSQPGVTCQLVCQQGFELVGSKSLLCGNNGWTGTGGDFNIPQCQTPDEIGGDIVDKINSTLMNGVPTNMLFVLDDSESVGVLNFQTIKTFVQNIVRGFPLSYNRTAGLETFATGAKVDIPLIHDETCQFLTEVESVIFEGGGTDITMALRLAINEINKNGRHDQTLLFLITDGIDKKDPTQAANELKNNGVIIFGIGIGEYDQNQLEPLVSVGPDGTTNFFGVHDFLVFSAIGDYLNSSYIDQDPCP